MQGIDYSVDLVFVIDKTGSMSPVIDRVKAHALKFDGDLKKYMADKKRPIASLRVKVIAFGDLYADGGDWLQQSDFFSLPDQAPQFTSFVNGIDARGGGDDPENGLEALALAFGSPWSTSGAKRRHIIALWTDTTAHALETRATKSIPAGVTLPPDLPASFSQMFDVWNDAQTINQSSKRMILFAPDASPWNDIFNDWTLVTHTPTKAGEGLKEVDYNVILDEIANSI